MTDAASVRRRRLVTRHAGTVVGITVMGVWCLFPLYWMVVSSLKGQSAILDNALLPEQPTLENFVAVFGAQNNFGYALRNSLIIATTTTLVALVLAIGAAYALARLRFRIRPVVLGAILSASMFPGIALLTPLFQLFTDWAWIDQYQAMIFPNVSFALPLAVWILTSFFQQMPWELEQAAKVDGCTSAQAFRKVILPLAAPGVFTTAILVFISAWNEFLIASAMSTSLRSMPVTVAIAKFTGASQFETPYGTIMAAGATVTIPLIAVVMVFQRRITSGLTAGSVKG